MTEVADPLVLDFVEWIAREPRAYSEVIGAWNTSVPISGGGGTVTSFDGYVADGAVRPFTPPPGPLVTW